MAKTMSRPRARWRSTPFTRVTTSTRAEVRRAGRRLAERTEGVEPLGARPLAVGLLQVARGHVVHRDERRDPGDAPPPRSRAAAGGR